MEAAGVRHIPVRGTQSFVHTLSACWVRPWLTGLEVLWRWTYGIPALLLVYWQLTRVLRGISVDTAALERMTLLEPVAASETLMQQAMVVMPPLLRVCAWLGPVLALGWVVASGLGRTAVLRRADPRLHRRPGTLMVLHAVRLAGMIAMLAVWYGALVVDGRWTVSEPIAAGQEPSVVLCCALAIVATLGLFSLWAVVSRSLAVAPLVAMRRDLGVRGSLRVAWSRRPVNAKLIEINLVMGIVTIALLVLAMVLSASPLPFESVATPGFMAWWYAGVGVLYLLGSDFFHVVQLVSYLELEETFDGDSGDGVAGSQR